VPEIDEVMDITRVYFYGMHSYFDPDEFIESPIKTSVILKVFTVNTGVNSQQLYNLKQMNAILYNSYLSTSMGFENYTYYDF
jgi:hypothetical protein